MNLARLTIKRFTAFEDATFEFTAGVNTLVGVNGTGKSHVLKLLFVLHEAARLFYQPVIERDEESPAPREVSRPAPEKLEAILKRMLEQVFRPDAIGRLVRRRATGGEKTAAVEITWTDGDGEASLGFTLTHRGGLKARRAGGPPVARPAVFLPTREVLSFFKGFTALWEKYQLEFDRTYYDICQLLALPPLRGPLPAPRGALLAPLVAALGGAVSIENGGFYVKLEEGDLEASLLAEGLRKLAMLARLVVNGTLDDRSLLLWDEPEASMNPELAPVLARTALALADQGVQVVLATHDYVLSSELSLEIEHRRARAPGSREAAFFSIQRARDGQREVERTPLFALLQTNPILDALASLHDRELAGEEDGRGA